MLINIDNILKEKGKTRYWLANTCGLRYQTISDLANGKTQSINFKIAEKICNALECELGDIFILDKTNDEVY